MKNVTRQILAAATITSVLSLLVGGFAVRDSYTSDLGIIDRNINTIAMDIKANPDDPITAALLSIEQNSFNVTVAFRAPTGEIAVLKESKDAILGETKKLRARNVPIQEGEEIVIAASLGDLEKNLKRNLWRLFIFILFANALASFISILLSRSGALATERAQREKMQEFLGDAAHELRTPLTVVKGYAELLKSKALEGEREVMAFDRLNTEIKRMESLIADLLILAELGEESPPDFSLVDLSHLVQENIQDFKVIAPQHNLTLDMDEKVLIKGSEKYLQRFIANALTNIRVHTQSDSPVRITLKAGKEISFIIEDGGAGLPEESYGEKIQGLKRFDRSRSRETGGSGLGMSIMSGVIERHGGVLTLRKSQLGGLAIEVQLPRT